MLGIIHLDSFLGGKPHTPRIRSGAGIFREAVRLFPGFSRARLSLETFRLDRRGPS